MRRQPPVHSPMSARALAAGAAAALRRTPTNATEALVRGHWHVQDVLLTDSGTSALSLAMRATCAHKRLVALPAFACYDIATAADGADVDVVLYDVDPATLAPDADSLARAIERRPAAVVIVHLYGLAVDVNGVQRAADAVGAVVIEDAAQAFGTTINGLPAGSIGSLGVLSFGRGKGLSAAGGGAVLARDTESAARLRATRTQLVARSGWSEWTRAAAQSVLARPALYALPASLPFLRLGETIYHDYGEPHDLSRASRRMLEYNWQRSLAEVAVRQGNARRFGAAVNGAGQLRAIAVNEICRPGYLRYPLLAEGRDARLTAHAKRLGIMPSYPQPLSQLAGFQRRCINATESFPGAEQLARSLLTLPTHGLLTTADLQRLEQWLS